MIVIIILSTLTYIVRSNDFFRFPLKDVVTLKKWVVAMRRENFTPSASSRLCSDHFRTEDFQVRPGAVSRWLKEGAVPSVFEFPDHLKVQAMNIVLSFICMPSCLFTTFMC